MKSKVIGVSIKDRGAILPAGHIPNGAYWYDEGTGEFVSSIFYHKELPGWVNDFNGKKYADSLLNQTWDTMLPIDQYTESGPDHNVYEKVMEGKEKPVFPYNLKELSQTETGLTASSPPQGLKAGYKLLPTTPYGNTITTLLAVAALKGESLGQDLYPDFLTISYSSTDKAGHAFGPQSVEVEDIYLRLDQELATLLTLLDKTVGKDEYLVFLTADHAVAEIPGFLKDMNIPAGNIDEDGLKNLANEHLVSLYGEGEWVVHLGNEQLFLNEELVHKRKLDLPVFQQKVCDFLIKQNGIANAYPAAIFHYNNFNSGMEALLKNGYHRKRSGDILMTYEPAWVAHEDRGTSHGSGYTYDTHVPLLWYGWRVKSGVSYKYQTITDIAPTLAFLLNIKLPNGATGKSIETLLYK